MIQNCSLGKLEVILTLEHKFWENYNLLIAKLGRTKPYLQQNIKKSSHNILGVYQQICKSIGLGKLNRKEH